MGFEPCGGARSGEGERIGVDGSTTEANAALRTIARRGNGETCREFLIRTAEVSSVETPTFDDLVHLDRERKGRTPSNEDWKGPVDPDTMFARTKDGPTRLTFRSENAVDLDAGVVVAMPVHSTEPGDTTTLGSTVDEGRKNLTAPASEDPDHFATDKGYHSHDGLKELDGSPRKTRIAEPNPPIGYLRWLHKRYLIHVAWFNLSVLMSARGPGGPQAAELRPCSWFNPILPWRSPSSRPSTAQRQCSSFSSRPRRFDQRDTWSAGSNGIDPWPWGDAGAKGRRTIAREIP